MKALPVVKVGWVFRLPWRAPWCYVSLMAVRCVLSGLVFDWLEIMYDVEIGHSKKTRVRKNLQFLKSGKLGSSILS